jgi:hypothetical protein
MDEVHKPITTQHVVLFKELFYNRSGQRLCHSENIHIKSRTEGEFKVCGGSYSSVGVVARLVLGQPGVRFPAGTKKFSCRKFRDLIWGPPKLRGTGVVSAGAKCPGSEFNHLPRSSSYVKNEWSCTFTTPICLPCVNRVKVRVT